MHPHQILTLLAISIGIASTQEDLGSWPGLKLDLDLRGIYQNAEDNLEAKLAARVVDRAAPSYHSRRKGNQYSKEMGKRNEIFKNIANRLETEFKMEREEAKSFAKQALVEHRTQGSSPIMRASELCNAESPVCDDLKGFDVTASRFRTIEGQCNNLENPFWGSFMWIFPREIDVGPFDPKTEQKIVDKENGCNSANPHWSGELSFCKECECPVQEEDNNTVPVPLPRIDDPSITTLNNSVSDTTLGCPKRTNLPSPRTITNTLNTDIDIPSTQVTHMVAQFGQFLDHDIALTPEHHFEDGNYCCTSEGYKDKSCYPIPVRLSDTFYGPLNVNCLHVTRTLEFCAEHQGTWQSFNEDTHFIDASNVYGSTDERAKLLRSMELGKLRVEGVNNLLPLLEDGLGNPDLEETAGDIRATEMPGLASMHTMMVREHNRLCDIIIKIKPEFSDEEIYQNARRILIGEWQSIVYNGYLPVVLGEDNLKGLKVFRDGTTYDKNTNPSMANEFATAAYRFGHSMIQGIIRLFATDNSGFTGEEYKLHTEFFQNKFVNLKEGTGFQQILMGLVSQPAQTFDKQVTEELTNFLFPVVTKTVDDKVFEVGQDLIARNIHRGRDHGFPGFCCYYKLHQNETESDFDCNSGWEVPYEDFSPSDWAQLQTVYAKPSDIDLFTGGLFQKPKNGGLTGKVFNQMKIEQFQRSRDGDRFFFTHKNEKGSFTRRGRGHLLRRTLAGIMCDNTKITHVPKDVFELTAPDKFISCDDTSSLGKSRVKDLLKFQG